MSVDILRLKSWAEDLIPNVTIQGEPGAEFLLAIKGSVSLVIKSLGPDRRQISHYRRIPESEIHAQWGVPGQTELPVELFTRQLENLATGYPLLDITVTRGEGPNLLVTCEAMFYTEGLTRQAYAWSLSSVLKATQAIDCICAERVRQMAHKTEMPSAPAPVAEALPAAAAVAQIAFCPECGSEAEAEAAFCGSCGQRLK